LFCGHVVRSHLLTSGFCVSLTLTLTLMSLTPSLQTTTKRTNSKLTFTKRQLKSACYNWARRNGMK